MVKGIKVSDILSKLFIGVTGFLETSNLKKLMVSVWGRMLCVTWALFTPKVVENINNGHFRKLRIW